MDLAMLRRGKFCRVFEGQVMKALRDFRVPGLGTNLVDLGMIRRIKTQGLRAEVVVWDRSPGLPPRNEIKRIVKGALEELRPHVYNLRVTFDSRRRTDFNSKPHPVRRRHRHQPHWDFLF